MSWTVGCGPTGVGPCPSWPSLSVPWKRWRKISAAVRDIDEQFGGRSDRSPSIARQAEQLEQGLAYLLGVLSVAVSSENLSPYNWRLVERDIQEVHAIAGDLQDKQRQPTEKAAA